MGSSDRIRQSVVAASAVLAVVGAFVGSGAAGGTPIQDAAGGALAADATLLAPGGPAFVIWTPIYAGLLAYAVWQFLPRQTADPRQRRLGYPVAASLLLNAAWILSVQFGLLALSVLWIALLLGVLVFAFFRLLASRPGSTVESIVLDGTMGLYLGWVCVATSANVTAALAAAGFDGFGAPAQGWGVGIVVVAGAVGLLLAIRGRGRFTPAIALCWGLTWIAVARLNGDLVSAPVAITAIIAAAVVVVVTLISRFAMPRAVSVARA